MTAGELVNMLMLLPSDAPVVIEDEDGLGYRTTSEISNVVYLRWPGSDQQQVRIS